VKTSAGCKGSVLRTRVTNSGILTLFGKETSV